MASFALFFKYLIIYIVGFILGSFGGLFSEASGIINIALEGAMIFGAFSGIVFLNIMLMPAVGLTGTWLLTNVGGIMLVYLMAAVIAIVFSILFSFLLSFAAIKLKADQTIVGTALNSLAVAACTIINTNLRQIDSPEIPSNVFSQELILKTGNVFIDNAFSGLNISLAIGFVLIFVLWILMNKTRFGLRLRACGENPSAADSVGINVYKMRYVGTAIGSASAGLAGFVIFSCMPLGTWQIDALGYGFLVLAIEIFGNWKATNIVFCSLFFAFFFAFAPSIVAIMSANGSPLSGTLFGERAFYYLLPYLLAFISLIIFSKHSRAPKAEGIPYEKSIR